MLKYQKVKVNKIKKDNSLYDYQYLRRKEGIGKRNTAPNIQLKSFLKANLARLNTFQISKPDI